jgi:hypothetical protein
MTNTCKICGRSFEAKQKRQRVCGPACKVIAWREYSRIYQRAYKPSGRTPAGPTHIAGGVTDNPRTDAREARIAGLAGHFEANTLILMRRTGLTRAAAVSLPCRKADEILKGIRQ